MPIGRSKTARAFGDGADDRGHYLLILAAIEIPNLMRARMAANQAAAVSNLKTIEAAEITYASPTITAILPLSPNWALPDSLYQARRALIDGMLSHGEKGGYSYLYIPGPVVDGKVETYTLKAVPSMPCTTGDQYYSIDPSNQSSVLAQNFQAVVQQDFIAQVLKGSMGHGQTACAP